MEPTLLSNSFLVCSDIDKGFIPSFRHQINNATMELSEVVLKKTKRNAFHVVQFLRSLQDKGFIKISSSCFHFEWDLGKIQSETDAAANVASLIQCTIDRIPLETREVLKVAAFLGSRFDIRTLEQVIEGFSEINAHIQVAIDEGIVGKGRRSSSFKFAHDQICKLFQHLPHPSTQNSLQIY